MEMMDSDMATQKIQLEAAWSTDPEFMSSKYIFIFGGKLHVTVKSA